MNRHINIKASSSSPAAFSTSPRLLGLHVPAPAILPRIFLESSSFRNSTKSPKMCLNEVFLFVGCNHKTRTRSICGEQGTFSCRRKVQLIQKDNIFPGCVELLRGRTKSDYRIRTAARETSFSYAAFLKTHAISSQGLQSVTYNNTGHKSKKSSQKPQKSPAPAAGPLKYEKTGAEAQSSNKASSLSVVTPQKRTNTLPRQETEVQPNRVKYTSCKYHRPAWEFAPRLQSLESPSPTPRNQPASSSLRATADKNGATKKQVHFSQADEVQYFSKDLEAAAVGA